jgi:hypothetical protein
MALMGNSSCFTALSEVTALNWQITMFYDPVFKAIFLFIATWETEIWNLRSPCKTSLGK